MNSLHSTRALYRCRFNEDLSKNNILSYIVKKNDNFLLTDDIINVIIFFNG